VGDSWLHETVCRERPDMWVPVGYSKLCVDRYLNCGLELVSCNCVYRDT